MRYRPLTLTTATLAAVLALSSVSTLADVNLKNVNPSPLALNVQTEGAGCGTATGATAFTAAGLPLSCQSGVWRRASTWNSDNVTAGTSCSTVGAGSFARGSDGKLYVCR